MSIREGPELPAARTAPGAPPPPASLVRMALVFYALVAGAAWLWVSLEGRSLWFASDGAQGDVQWGRDAALGIGVGAALIGASRVLTRLSASARALAERLAALLGHPGTLVCFVLAAVSGFAEEALFRSALQPRVGIWIASALFALAHFVPRRELIAWPIFAFVAGLCFGALFDATGGLLAPALAHFSVNAVNLRWLASREPSMRAASASHA